MASYCTKCGAPLTSSTGSCISCGAPVGGDVIGPAAISGAVPPPPAGYAGVAVPPPIGYPAMAGPAPSSSSALKIILIVVAVVVGLGIIGAGIAGYAVWRVAHSVRMNSNGNGMSLSVPGGPTISAGDSTLDDADLGVPLYPGATREKGTVQMNSSSASMAMAHFSTSDSPSQVVDFYKSKMGDGVQEVSGDTGTVLNSGRDGKDHVMVTVGTGSGDDSGKTTIVIMHSKKGS